MTTGFGVAWVRSDRTVRHGADPGRLTSSWGAAIVTTTRMHPADGAMCRFQSE